MNRLTLIATSIGSSNDSKDKIVIEKADGAATVWLSSLKDLNCLSVAMTSAIK
jgi:hypothetical protein